MTQDAATLYVNFYDVQIARTRELGRQRLVSAVVLAILLSILLVFLGSPISVWAGVTILYLGAYYGLGGVKTALGYTTSALEDLSNLASFVREPRSREELSGWALAHVKADDSNVPEALRDLCSVQGGAGVTRVAANAAFTQPASQLSRTYFLRTALVLGGLFGTVFFFAVELGNDALLTGSLKTLLPGLKGALACTLTGILGSLSLGYFASEIDGLIERSTWETEAFLGGPIAAILQRVPEVEAVNEVQLWSLLLDEVRKLRTDTAESYAKLGNDATAYAVALQTVSNQLADLPAIQVPAQLADLQTVVRDFHGGTKILDGAVTTLVNAVGTVGLYFPSATIDRLQALETQMSVMHESESEQMNSLVGALDRTDNNISAAMANLTDAASGIRGIESSLGDVSAVGHHHSERLETAISAAESAAATLVGLNSSVEWLPTKTATQLIALFAAPHKKQGTTDESSAVEATPETAVSSALPAIGRSSTATAPETSGAPGLEHSEIAAAISAMSEAKEEFTSQASLLAVTATNLQADRSTLSRILSSVEEMETVVKWHKKASNAPLMKLLLLPFRPARQSVKRNAS